MRFSPLLMVCLSLLFCACREEQTLFEKVSSARSGIDFNNRIVENDTINPTDVVNVYNGGGVGIGDFNNDGLQDLFFTGNMVPCRLYLNKGSFSFDDVTEQAGVEGMGRWARGVSVVDINNDGLQDIYICNTIYKDSLRRRNILYINKGVENGIPRFEDKAAEYGLDIHVQSTMGNFFDYDNDGDLDFFLTANEATSEINPSAFGKNSNTRKDRGTGRLYRNDKSPQLNHPVFTEVSARAGLTLDGYGHGATITDINNDGWKD
ncbi:MAG TPA: VCBS repeat-containing protein, partial [Chitinophagaceae bacterium]|nr:VCBS repeat-containing protein [Chitinophagaceae bacterium]